jgi:hypothetical protein
VDQDDLLAQQLRACDGHIAGCLQAFVPDVETAAPQAPPARPWRSSRRTPLSCEVQASVEAMTGVDLTQSEGIASLTALKGLRAIGLEMTRWPTSKHCAAWLGNVRATNCQEANAPGCGAHHRRTGQRRAGGWRPRALPTVPVPWGPLTVGCGPGAGHPKR